jgi:hypothetical protein
LHGTYGGHVRGTSGQDFVRVRGKRASIFPVPNSSRKEQGVPMWQRSRSGLAARVSGQQLTVRVSRIGGSQAFKKPSKEGFLLGSGTAGHNDGPR